MRLTALFLFSGLLLGACSDSSTPLPICTGEAEAAVIIELRDATSQSPVLGAMIELTEDGGFTETMAEGPDGIYSGGRERPGLYRFEVVATGYAAYTESDITVPAGPCGPATRRLVVELTPTATPVLVIRPAKPGVWVAEPARLSVR